MVTSNATDSLIPTPGRPRPPPVPSTPTGSVSNKSPPPQPAIDFNHAPGCCRRIIDRLKFETGKLNNRLRGLAHDRLSSQAGQQVDSHALAAFFKFSCTLNFTILLIRPKGMGWSNGNCTEPFAPS